MAGAHGVGFGLLAAGTMALAGCGGGGSGAGVDAGPDDAGSAATDAGGGGLDRFLDAALWDYAWACTGEVAPTGAPLASDPPAEDCSAGVWPDLDPLAQVCPTLSDIVRDDPVSGTTLPPAGETRALPVEIPVSETGSFLPPDAPASWPATLKIVAWNMEYSSHLDEQMETLATHPSLRDADVYLLSEVDRCSARNGVRRAARELARRLGAAYAYGIEFVELSIGRTLGGDTGQAIVSRRPLTGVRLECHHQAADWFSDDDQPRLGERVFLGGDVPVGDRFARVHAVHFESKDITGENRAVQVREVLDDAQSTACERPIAIAGDFNTWYETAPELRLLRNAGFEDALLTAGDTGVTHPENDFRIDYVWTRGFAVRAGGVARDVTTSDHYPLWVELELR